MDQFAARRFDRDGEVADDADGSVLLGTSIDPLESLLSEFDPDWMGATPLRNRPDSLERLRLRPKESDRLLHAEIRPDMSPRVLRSSAHSVRMGPVGIPNHRNAPLSQCTKRPVAVDGRFWQPEV
jgi:hypothetical protein